MSSISIVKKRHNVYIHLKLAKNETLNLRECDLLEKRQVEEFLPITYAKKDKSIVRYDISGMVSLSQFLRIVVNKSNFIHIVLTIINTLKNTSSRTLYNKNILLNSDYIFVNPTTKQIRMVYIPIANYNAEINAKAFLYELPFKAVFNQTEDCSYVKEYINYFKNSMNFSLFELEKMLEDMEESEKNKPLPHSSKFLGKEEIPLNRTVIQREQNGDNRFFDVEPQKKVMEQAVESYCSTVEETGTTVLGLEECGTTVLSQNTSGNISPTYPVLTRIKTKENIYVDKEEFTIGKSKSADYTIDNNTAVSRLHITLYTRNNDYYVKDNNSTNGTFIDGTQIEPETEVQLKSGQILKLADEEISIQ